MTWSDFSGAQFREQVHNESTRAPELRGHALLHQRIVGGRDEAESGLDMAGRDFTLGIATRSLMDGAEAAHHLAGLLRDCVRVGKRGNANEPKTATMTRLPFPGFRSVTLRFLSAAWLTLASSLSLLAADTNFVNAVRAALQSPTAGWGGVNLGTPLPVVVESRAGDIADRLRQAVGQRVAGQAASPAAVPAGALIDPQKTLQQSAASVGQTVEIHVRPGNQTVMQIRGPVLEPATVGLAGVGPADLAEQTARRFLRANRALLRLDDPDQELRLDLRQQDDLGRQHLRFSQMYAGLVVWPDGLSVHLDPQGNIDVVDGAYVPTPRTVETNAVLTAIEATGLAQGSVAGGEQGQAKDPELIIYAPFQAAPRLAWKTVVSVDFSHAWVVVVDALDGRVLNRLTQCFDANVPTTGLDLENVSRNINVWSANNKFYLVDTTKPSFNPAFDPLQDPHGAITIFDARLVTEQQLQTVFIVESANVSNWLPDAVSALYNFGHTYDYFQQRHNRNSLDGLGGNVRAAVRVAQMDNAFWNGDQKMMFFGNVRPYPNALDVVGHELAHGVTQNSADLIYELQPGALNESFSDIFGEMVEARVNGQPDWKMGTKLGKIFRDLKDPGSLQIGGLNRPYPARMGEYVDLPNSNDADHGGVHINSSIHNHAFYLLAEGLPGAIGLQDAEKIFYRCLTQHLQKQSQFIDARLGSIAAAEALYGAGSAQAAKTAEAFDAVEILAKPPTPDPTPLPTVQGPDSTLLVAFDPFSGLFGEIALGRREAAFSDPIDGVALVESVKLARPSVSGDGSFAVFVDSINDLGLVNTAPPFDLQSLGLPGQVHSVAMSPDGNRFAFVLRDALGEPDNRITVVDLAQNTNGTFTLLAPVQDGNAVDTVLYADSMVFTADGTQLIYDALSQISFGDGSRTRRWSISRINLSTATTTVLVPPLEGFDTGNPNIGRAGNRYLTFDANDLTTTNTSIINLDLFTGDFATVGSAGQGAGYPCFTGDEKAVIYAASDPAATWTGRSLVKQDLAANRLTTSGQPTVWLPDAWVGVIYRRGTFASSNALPSVTLTGPTNNSTFTPPATITLTAGAGDAGGIARVEFYEGANKLGEDVNSPYQFIWSNVSSGNYRFTARAIDNLGGASDSATASVTVGQSALIGVSAARLSGNGIRIAVTAPAGNYTVQDSTTLTNWTDAFPLTIGASGTGTLDDSRAPATGGRLYYRVRRN